MAKNIKPSKNEEGQTNLKLFNLEKWELTKTQLSALDFLEIIKNDTENQFMLGEGGKEEENDNIPAGYTYLGQFIAHDIIFNPNTHTDVNEYFSMRNNLRSPFLNLDSVYGDGPIGTPMYYDQSILLGKTHFLLDVSTVRTGTSNFSTKYVYDLQRKLHGNDKFVPIIPDIRNDENVILSQLHVAFQLFHNKVTDDKVSQKFGSVKKETIEAIKELGLKDRKSNKIASKLIEKVQVLSHDKMSFSVSHGGLPKEEQPKNLKEQLKEIFDSNKLQETADKIKASEKSVISKIQSEIITSYDQIFVDARKEVIKHYQWVILYDFLPKIVGKDIIEQIITSGEETNDYNIPKLNLKFYEPKEKPLIPLEFSVAAFRFGHSMVQVVYDSFERNQIKLFEGKRQNEKLSELYINWSFFFKEDTEKVKNKSLLIEPFISKNMKSMLPVERKVIKSIIYRNLERSRAAEVSSGQAIARDMNKKEESEGKKTIINQIINYKSTIGKYEHNEIEYEGDRLSIKNKFLLLKSQLLQILPEKFEEEKQTFLEDFFDNSPLWFYILIEALEQKGGKALGEVGGRIIAETIIGLLASDENSILHTPKWTPDYFINSTNDKERKCQLQSNIVQENGNNCMIEFLKFAGVYRGALVNINKTR